MPVTMTESLLRQVCAAENLPSLPNVAIQVLRMTRDEGVTVDELAEVIQNDPALSGKLLRVVNSSMFGVPREVSTVRQAMVILGLRTVRVLALSFSLVDVVQGSDDNFRLDEFWRRSLNTAVAAKLFSAKTAPGVTEEAFVTGLLADIGMFAAWRCAPDVYIPVLEAARRGGADLWTIEVERLGASHAAMSKALLESWNLPQTICAAVAAHHGEGPTLPDDAGSVARAVQAAALIASVFCGDTPAAELDATLARCTSITGIPRAELDECLQSLDEYVRETASVFSLKIGATVDFAQLQSEAAAQLAQLSMQAEVERAAATRNLVSAEADRERLLKQNQQIRFEARTDRLTRLANRAAFDECLERAWQHHDESGAPVGLLILDVDHFKQFNDTYGHRVGDDVLRCVSACLSEIVGEIGLAARYGGEEFAVILAGAATTRLGSIGEQIRSLIESSVFEYAGQDLHVTVSVGGACAPTDQRVRSSGALVELADQRLYAAKRGGRNRVVSE